MEPLTLALVSLAICAFGVVSGRAERSPFTAPMFFTGLGVAFSSVSSMWLGMDVDSGVVHGLAELTLILVLFTDATRIDLQCLRRERGLPSRLLGLGMPLTLLAGAAVALALFPGMPVVEAALLAAILMPTDAALGQAVVSNVRVPVRIRQSLNVESGLNDGVALPVVLVIASMAGALEGAERDAAYWIRFALLAVTLGPLVGVAVGWGGGQLMGWATERGWVSEPFQRIAAPGLALAAFSLAELVGGNGFIAAFVAGLAVGNVAREICPCLYEFGEAEGQLLGLLVFLVFGGLLVPKALAHVGAMGVVYALLSLTVVRMLPVWIGLLGSGLKLPSVAFLGWFGPRGLASILFVLLVVEPGRLERGNMLEAVVVATVLLSTFLHGLTAFPLASAYGKWVDGMHESAEEHAMTEDMPVRIRHASPTS